MALLLDVRNLSVLFGGVLALNKLSLEIAGGEIIRIDRPERRGENYGL